LSGPETRFSTVFLGPTGHYRNGVSRWVMLASFNILSGPLFTRRPTTRRYIRKIWATD